MSERSFQDASSAKSPSADDRFAVQDLLMRYVWATDTGDIESFVDVFTPDAKLIASSGEAFEGRAGIRRFALAQVSPADVRGRMHFFQPIRFDARNGAIHVFSFWMVVQTNVAGDVKKIRSTGATTDICVKSDGAWLFQRREIMRWNDRSAPWLFADPGLPPR